MSLLLVFQWPAQVLQLEEVELLSADNDSTGRADTSENQDQRFCASCSWTVRVGLSAPHFGNAPQQAVGVICRVTRISCGLSPSSQEQALSPVSQLRA